jgi:hypothetical protein
VKTILVGIFFMSQLILALGQNDPTVRYPAINNNVFTNMISWNALMTDTYAWPIIATEVVVDQPIPSKVSLEIFKIQNDPDYGNGTLVTSTKTNEVCLVQSSVDLKNWTMETNSPLVIAGYTAYYFYPEDGAKVKFYRTRN